MSPLQMLRTTVLAALMLAISGPAICGKRDCDPAASKYVVTILKGESSGTCSIQIVDWNGASQNDMTVWRGDSICVQNRWSVWRPVDVEVTSETNANDPEDLHGGARYTIKKGTFKRRHTRLVVQSGVQHGKFKYVFGCTEKKDGLRPFATPRYIIVEPPPGTGQDARDTDHP